MLKEAIVTAATVEEATENALAELAAPEDADVKIEVLEFPVKKTLGLFGGSPAKVRVSYEASSHAKAEAYIRTILENLDVQDAEITFDVVDEELHIQIACEHNYGAVIGRRGETLDAIQYLTRLVINKGGAQYKRISVNIGDYREKREGTLRALAKKQAARVKKYGRNVVLDPMNPYERRIIHTTIQEIDGVESHSVGSDDNRKVVITSPGGNRPRPGGRSYNDRRPASNQSRSYSNNTPTRAPRSDAASASRYGKIEPKA